ncbi:MAG: ABC transporter ATP-binding protein [Bauldia sp.]|nr:MAG: ABC transporter ATP-binding protein [Bauldia sp.]
MAELRLASVRDIAAPEVSGAAGDAPLSISIRDASKIFRRDGNETVALGGVDLDIRRGEFIAVVGPSGCGKSTLMRLIGGLIAPTGGEIIIDGTAVGAPVTDLGIVFQKPILLEWRTVLENVLFQIDMRGLRKRDYLDGARRLLAAVGLAEFENRYPHELSGGMQQRASIARALIHEPPLLLMDEPFGALDALTREQMRIDLEELWLSTRKTVVFITHSIDEAVLLADRVVVMTPRPGRIDRVIEIDLERPRGLAARKTRAFTAAVEEITELFLANGTLHSSRPVLNLLKKQEP